MTPVLAGVFSAAAWGTADFAARFTCRAVGASVALLAVTLVGATSLSAWLAFSGHALPSLSELAPWDAANGIATTISMLLLYEALRRGPLSLVSPLVGAYPLWELLLAALFMQVRPAPATWLAMAAIMAGMWIVAANDGGESAVGRRRGTAMLAVAAGMAFGVALVFAQQAVLLHGALPALWLGRLIGLAGLAALLVPRWRSLRVPLPWAAVLSGQGVLDTLGYLFLYASGTGLAAGIATVVSSTFGLVTVALARVFLREPISIRQWLGIALVFAGVAGLSAAPR